MRNGRVKGQVVLCFVIALVKCTTIYFSGAKDAPCLQAQYKQCSWTVCSVLQYLYVVLSKVTVFASPTGPLLDDGDVCLLQALTRLAMSKSKRVVESR